MLMFAGGMEAYSVLSKQSLTQNDGEAGCILLTITGLARHGPAIERVGFQKYHCLTHPFRFGMATGDA
jgi:hypothetical protein